VLFSRVFAFGLFLFLSFGNFLFCQFFEEGFFCCSVLAHSNHLAFGIGLNFKPGQIALSLIFEVFGNNSIPFGNSAKGKIELLVCSGTVEFASSFTISIALPPILAFTLSTHRLIFCSRCSKIDVKRIHVHFSQQE